MLQRSSDCERSRREAGQITVFLSLAFLLLMSSCFIMIEGVREYMTGALAEDALEGASLDVLANYDKPLFERYHIFFLDPREKGQIQQDAADYLNRYNKKSSFFGWTCRSLKVTFLDSPTDGEGKLFKHQIREWTKYGELNDGRKRKPEGSWNDPEEKQKIADMFETYASMEHKISEYRDELLSTPAYGYMEESALPGKEDGGGQTGEGDGLVDEEEEEEISEEAILWKSIREGLDLYEDSDLLYSCLASAMSLSGLETDLMDLPSHGKRGDGLGGSIPDPACSLREPAEFAALFPSSGKVRANHKLFHEEDYLLSYAGQVFDHFPAKAGKKASDSLGRKEKQSGGGSLSDQKALAYEMEYMLEGKKSDVKNLRRVVHRIFSQRFFLNYDYARNHPALWNRADRIAVLAAGQEGMPDNPEAGRLLLTGAAAYGQTLLDLKKLLSGKRVALLPGKGGWRVTYESLPDILRKGQESDQDSGGISYSDYLYYYLARKDMEKILCWRMMDVMQLNVRLSEEGFRMRDCLFSFRWEADLQSVKWFPSVPGFDLISDSFMGIKLKKTNSY